MDMNAILSAIGKMFPSVNLGQAVNKAQEAMKGVPDTFDGVSQAAAKMGIDRGFVERIYGKYGATPQARMICSMLGTTPEALKSDAEKIVGGTVTAPVPNTNNSAGTASTKKFPRLK